MPRVRQGNSRGEHGPGVSIELTGDEVALAIDAWLVARNIHVNGPRTITVNNTLCGFGCVYVDPSGEVIVNGERFSGREPDQVKCVTCGWGLIRGTPPGSLCSECANRAQEAAQRHASTPSEHATLGTRDTYRCTSPGPCGNSGLCAACRARGAR